MFWSLRAKQLNYIFLNKFTNAESMQLQEVSFSFHISFFFSVEEMANQSSSRASVLSNAADGLHPVPERSISYSPDHLHSAVTDIFVSEEKIGKMENILDIWSNNLKVGSLSHNLQSF